MLHHDQKASEALAINLFASGMFFHGYFGISYDKHSEDQNGLDIL